MQGHINVQDEITQIEGFIKDNIRLLKQEETIIYHSLKERYDQSHNCKEEHENYLTSLKCLKYIVKNKHNNETLDKLHKELNKIKKKLKKCGNRIDGIVEENENNYRKMQELSNAYKEQKGASMIFAISAVVLVALVGYVVFFQLTCPSCILDNAVVKQNVAALVNSAI